MSEHPSEAHAPTSIERDGDTGIQITWDDQTSTHWTTTQLRKACPCATCREKRRGQADQISSAKSIGLPILSAAEAKPLRIESMRPVGTYAYNISFSDGHSSGIFQLAMLYDGPEQDEARTR